MTEREEQAVVVLNTLQDNPLLSDIHRQALEVGIMAIKALSSSEKLNKWIGAEVLDKISVEIEEQYDRVHPYDISCAEGLEMALGIIDKYKPESEGKDGND